MANPFVDAGLGKAQLISPNQAELSNISEDETIDAEWLAKRDPKSGSILTDDKMRLMMQPKGRESGDAHATMKVSR